LCIEGSEYGKKILGRRESVGEFFEKAGISRSNVREACIVWEKSSRRELPRMGWLLEDFF
jgi:hypothetical protein